MGALETVLSIVAPVFMIMGLGFAYGRTQKFDEKTLANLVFYILSPFLAFYGIARVKFEAGMIETTFWAAAIMLAMAALAYAVSKIAGLDDCRRRLLVNTAMFSNNGNMGFPLVFLAFGERGLAYGGFFVAASAFLMYSLGIRMICGNDARVKWYEFLKVPMIYSVALGVAFSVTGTALPAPVEYVVNLLGQSAMGLMLLIIGMQLSKVRLQRESLKLPALNVLLRTIAGPAVALAVCYLFGITGVMRGVLVLNSATPSAVNNFVLAAKYTNKSKEVASMIFASTLASLFTLPIVLSLLI